MPPIRELSFLTMFAWHNTELQREATAGFEHPVKDCEGNIAVSVWHYQG